MKTPRSRSETRAAILNYLWCSGGSFRPELADQVALTEASISRIILDLKTECLVEETRRTAPYKGGPSVFLTLSKNHNVGALEISNNRVHVGVGSLTGEIRFSERLDLPDGADGAEVERVTAVAVASLADCVQRRGLQLEQVAVSVPGYHPEGTANPIIALNPSALARHLHAGLPGVPVMIANSIVTRAVAHRLRMGVGQVGGPYFYVFAGHGVAGAVVDEFSGSGDVAPCEIGHMVFDLRGPRCRCGHDGCLEAYVSTAVVAPILNVTEADLLARGEHWPNDIRIPAKVLADLKGRLSRLGVAIGNALNLSRVRRVVVAGWPSGLGEEARAEIMAGIEASLLGGTGGVSLTLSEAELGREPSSGLALATFAFLRRGGESALPAKAPATTL